jgi:CSLREA domain-containing protein
MRKSTWVGPLFSKISVLSLLATSVPLTAQATVYTVNSANDVNDTVCDVTHCSLREAILAANANVSPPHSIGFNISGVGPHVITPTTVLPTITRETYVNASGEAIGNAPGVRIDGSSLAGSLDGLTFGSTADESTLSWLAITGFPRYGVNIASDFTIVTNCYVGIGTDGVTDLGNAWSGVRIAAPNVSIGTNTTTGNVISGNNQSGIVVEAGADASKIYGNKIGTNAAGTAAVPNGVSGVAGLGATGVFVGGGILANTENLISGNAQNGIRLESASQGWFVSRNLIGITLAGTAVLSNGYGIRIFGDGHFIGSNIAAARNVISGNTTFGIEVFGGADGNSIYGNFIGTNSAGTASLGVQPVGIRTVAGGTPVASLTIGGDRTTGYGNVISGHTGSGVRIESNVNNLVMTGNYIGTNAAGDAAVANAGQGIEVTQTDIADNNVVGGSSAGLRNVISGNGQGGIRLSGTGVVIKGNYIGLNAAGTAAIPNQQAGIRAITATNATIGGTSAADGNFISGNVTRGLVLDADTDGISIKANRVGLNGAGTAAIPNTETGILLNGTNHMIGGTTAGERNIISGNTGSGMTFSGSGHTIRGNYIGTNAAGTAAVPNGSHGIRTLTATNSTIGGTIASAANVISGNASAGVSLENVSTGISVKGNLIGLTPAGTATIPNGGSGVVMGGNNNLLGGGTAADRNFVSGNSQGGVVLGGTGNLVQGNYIGTDITGANALGNGSYGVRIYAGVDGELGGDTVGKGNLVSGNSRAVSLEQGATGMVLRNNIIGLNALMTANLPDNGSGIELYASGNTIGTPGMGNVIAGMTYSGIVLGGGASDNLIQANWIGTNKTLTPGLGNTQVGIFITDAYNNTIGGVTGANVIAYNNFFGVKVERGDNNLISRNSIFSNYLLGIDLGEQYVFPNDPLDPDIVGNRQQNYPLLSSVTVSGMETLIAGQINNEPNTQYTVEFFSSPDCDDTGMGEGKTYRGTAIINTDGNGVGTINSTLAAAIPDAFASATVTDPDGNTSEFSPCAQVGGENPGKLQFFRSVYLAYEGNLPTAEVIIVRSHGLSGTVSANFTISNNTATAGSDYTDMDQVVTFQPWEVVKVIQVPILVDPAIENPDPENALLALANPTGGATLGLAASEVLIFDQNPAYPGITIADAELVEGNSGQTALSFDVTLTPTNHPVTVAFLAESGNALVGEDFLAAEGTLEFEVSDDPQTLQATVQILGDNTFETDEVVWMRITVAEDGGNWIAYDTYGLGLIINDDDEFQEPPPEVWFKDGFEDPDP